MRVADLHAAVASTLASKRLGTLVFVRYLLQTQDKPAAVNKRLEQAADVIRGWINQPIDRIYAQGQVSARAVLLTVEFRGGSTAVLGWSTASADGNAADLLLVGNRGSMTYESGNAALWNEGPFPLETIPLKADESSAPLAELIDRALRSGRPETGKK